MVGLMFHKYLKTSKIIEGSHVIAYTVSPETFH